jgi:hypothetical protein
MQTLFKPVDNMKGIDMTFTPKSIWLADPIIKLFLDNDCKPSILTLLSINGSFQV